jgi:hypothetical protein
VQETESNAMAVFLFLEASRSEGSCYRLGLGCLVHPKVASMVVLFLRLF